MALTLALVVIVLASILWGGGKGAPSKQTGTRSTGATRAMSASRSPALAGTRVTVAQTGTLPIAEQDAAAAVVTPSSFLLIGGLDQAETSLARIVSATSSRARTIATMPAALHDASASFTAGDAYVFGGGVVSSFPQITKIDAGGRTQPAGELPTPASDVASAVIGETVYIVGGYTGVTPLRTILAWHPGGPARTAGMLPKPLRYAAVSTVGGQLVIAGGTSGETASYDIYRFDPSTGAVSTIGLLPDPLTHAAATSINGTMIVLGGRGSSPTSQTRGILSISQTGKVNLVGLLPVGLSDLAAVSLEGHIVIAGGRDAGGHVHDEILTATVTPS
ncbi:MAG TPA: kelch repeat-containing protein [Solirubrobacteraceae bacterium]|jgi:N-acetylneuraminic acid mutarotase|nr:kelch repeat-containing protein [Solirubrobacteraceae bacterium]